MNRTPQSIDIATAVDVLANTAAEFEAALSTLGRDAFRRRPNPDEWSPLEILLHVRASDLIVSSRIWAALIRYDGAHPGLDERKYGDLLATAGLSVDDHAQAFVLRRRELISLLRGLSVEHLRSTVRTDFDERAVSQVVIDLAAHEREHIGQLQLAVAATKPGPA